MKIKIRPSVMIISLGLVVALVWAVIGDSLELVSILSVALIGALTKLVESEEVSDGK